MRDNAKKRPEDDATTELQDVSTQCSTAKHGTYTNSETLAKEELPVFLAFCNKECCHDEECTRESQGYSE